MKTMNIVCHSFSVVIPTYRRFDALKMTLESLCALSSSLHEVILVDQSPAPENKKIHDAVLSFQARGLPVRLLISDTPSSTKARNIGLSHASGEWVVFCDDDVIWPVDLVEKLSNRLKEFPSLVMVGGLDFENPSPMRSKTYNFLRWLTGAGSLRQNRGIVLPAILGKYPDKVDHPMDTEWAMGYWFAVDRGYALNRGILFDDKLKKYAYAEDLDFTHRLYRCAKSDKKACMLFPEVGVRHMVSKEWRIASDWLLRASVWNRYYLSSKFNGGFFNSTSPFFILYNAVFAIIKTQNLKSMMTLFKAHCDAWVHFKKIQAGDFMKIHPNVK